MDDLIAKALHAARHHLAGGGLLSGPDYLSTGEEVSAANWGNPDVASDFFKADKALRLAREIQAKADTEARRPPIPDRVVEEAPALPRAALRVAAEPSPQMAAMLARADADPGKIEGRAAPEADKIAARAPQGPELTDRDRDLIIRTIAAETSGKTPEESQAIAHVILNRIQSGKYGASPEAVLLAKKQFEPWSNPAGANYPMKFLPSSRRYGMGQAALEAALSGDDITGGALNFWGPKAQYALGRKAPGWAAEMPDYSDIGETRFHRPRAEGGGVDAALHMLRRHFDGSDGSFVDPQQMPIRDEDTYGPANIEERRAHLQDRLEAEQRATARYPGDELEAPQGYITPAKAARWIDTDAGPMAVDAEGRSLPLIQQPGVLPLYRDPTIDSVRMAMPKIADITGNMMGAPLGMTARRVIQAGMAGERPAANVMNIFAGEKAKTADLAALETAKDLLSKGETPKSVINQTGWFQGADGKWRFEISDYQSKMNTDPIFKQPSRFDLAGEYLEQQGVPARKFGTGQFPELDTAGLKYADEIIANRKGVPMEQVLEHPDLYAAYPEAKNIPVSKTQSANYGGSYDRNSNAITIGEPPIFGGDPDRPRSVALHELQHYIQQEENFARGANPYDLAEHMPSEAAINDAKILATIQRRGKEYPESWFMEHLGRDPDPIGLYIFRQHSLDEIANMPATPKEAYKRSAGETEARNVQYRRDMPPEELSQKVPWGTQGILNEHQIVKFESNGGLVDRALEISRKG